MAQDLHHASACPLTRAHPDPYGAWLAPLDAGVPKRDTGVAAQLFAASEEPKYAFCSSVPSSSPATPPVYTERLLINRPSKTPT